MTAFPLVHRAWHGAWSWERLVPELEARGHRVVAVDLPSDDATATFETYADAVVYALHAEEDFVVVGHSRGARPAVAAALEPRWNGGDEGGWAGPAGEL